MDKIETLQELKRDIEKELTKAPTPMRKAINLRYINALKYAIKCVKQCEK